MVGVGDGPGVAVGDWQKVVADTVPTLPPPETESTIVPNNPEVLTLVDCPMFNWNWLDAMGVLFKVSVQVPGPVMFEPILVMMNFPCASGVHDAETVRVGGTTVGVALGDWQKTDAVTVPTLPPPETEINSVPNSPDVLTEVDAPASNWKVLDAIGVPFRSRTQAPGPVISPPMSVMVKVPMAAGVQDADNEKTGADAWTMPGRWVGFPSPNAMAKMNVAAM